LRHALYAGRDPSSNDGGPGFDEAADGLRRLFDR
jgi:hypothetical protein